MSEKILEFSHKKTCSKCNRELIRDVQFYVSSNSLIHSDGRLPICKSCLQKLVDFSDRKSLINVLRAIDKPFIAKVYQSTLDSEKVKKMGEYMRLVGMPQTRDHTYADSVFGHNDSEISSENTEDLRESDFTKDEIRQLEELWGKGRSLDDYETLQREYESLLNAYDNDSYAMRVLLQEASYQRLTISTKRDRGENVDKEVKTLQEIFKSAKINPNQETGADSLQQETFGTLIKKYENERPIPEPDPEWKDVNKIKKYIDVFFKGHLMKMLGYEYDEQEYNEEIDKHTVEPPSYEGDS